MTSIIEFANLAWHVYDDKREALGVRIRKISNEDFKSAGYLYSDTNWYRLVDVGYHMQSHNPFYAQLYVKFEQSKAVAAVMAIRGTVLTNINNLNQDLVSFISDVLGDGKGDLIPVYLQEAIIFYQSCVIYLSKHFPHLAHEIKLTGHSLGGAVAQLMVLQAGFGLQVVAFNSPGCGHMPGVKSELANWICNVNAHYDFISKVGVTLGKLNVVEVQNEADLAQRFYEAFDHAIQPYAELATPEAKDSPSQLSSFLDKAKRINVYLASLRGAESPFIKRLSGTVFGMSMTPISAALLAQYDLSQFRKALMQQHSIDNLLIALYLPENQKVAHTFV